MGIAKSLWRIDVGPHLTGDIDGPDSPDRGKLTHRFGQGVMFLSPGPLESIEQAPGAEEHAGVRSVPVRQALADPNHVTAG